MSDMGKTFKRATGHGSLHGKDWLNLGLLAAGGTAGAGAAGYGPLASWLGGASAATPAWATGAGESLGGGLGAAFAPEAAWATGAGETLGGGLGASFGAPEAGAWVTGAGESLGGGLGGGGGMVDTIGGMNSLGGSGSSLDAFLSKAKGFAKSHGPSLLGGMAVASKFAPENQPMQQLERPPMMGAQVPNTALPSLGLITGGDTGGGGFGGGAGAGGLDINNPQVMAALMEMLKRQQGGAFA